MLTLHSIDSRRSAPKGSSGTWYELAPGPDRQKFDSPDSAYFWIDEWELVAEPLLAERLPGYNRHGRVNVAAPDWLEPLKYLDDVRARLATADDPGLVHVVASDLPKPLVNALVRAFPKGRDEAVSDLFTVTAWCRHSLKRWKSITIIGL